MAAYGSGIEKTVHPYTVRSALSLLPSRHMAIFRLLHASDLHVAFRQERIGVVDYWQAGLRFPRGRRRVRRTSSYSPDLLDGLIKLVYDQGDRFDAVLLSGDLATTGKEQDLDQARSCIDGDASSNWYSSPSSGRPEVASHWALKGAGRPILLLPGNHDRYKSVLPWPLFISGGTIFDEYFGHYWKVGQGVQGWVSPAKQGARLGLVSADLSLWKGDNKVGPIDSLGQGRAYADIIARLETLTGELRAEDPGLGLLWVVHFPPANPDIDNSLRLLDDEVLIKAAHEKRISHILSGHTHFPRDYIATSPDGSTVKVLCAGTATQEFAPDGNFIHEVEIEVGEEGITSVKPQTYQWYDQVGARKKGTDEKWVPVVCPKTKKKA
jgi:3',5'-cyclic AMP phosphodiesterase CpdA